MRQNERDEAGSGLLLRTDGRRKADSISAGRTRILVEEVLRPLVRAADTFFKVHADDGNLYILRRETSNPDGSWHLESFRQLPTPKLIHDLKQFSGSRVLACGDHVDQNASALAL